MPEKFKFERHPHGVILIDGQEVGHTLQCPHCGGHFVSRPGSGARRAWCPRCKAVTCGEPRCDVCVPEEEQLLYAEGNRKGKYAKIIEENKHLLIGGNMSVDQWNLPTTSSPTLLSSHPAPCTPGQPITDIVKPRITAAERVGIDRWSDMMLFMNHS